MSSAELARIAGRPHASPEGPLSAFYVEVRAWNEAEVFARRLRELVGAGVKAALEADFGAESVPEADVPGWAAEAWAEAAPRYAAHRGDEEWTVQDLLYAFQPGQRSWSWWDVTAEAGNVVCVWVDARGEAVYGCEELRWMVYAAGARSVVGPLVREAAEWQRASGVGR
ncbi:hypothetical protein [Streptomyces sp. NPDC031705]|uniref:hypothetical protein n=1 Tax=Streptomyces sp. NPDC031705 TaxID=3155729 RepID=UPI0034110CF3